MFNFEIEVKCMAIARLNYLNAPYVGQPILDLYKTGGFETKATGICHYCSIDVLEKIICNGSLRFTDIKYLEDTTEFVGNMPIIKFIKEAHITEEKLYCTYSCSLSTNKNSVQMWDTYAKEGANVCFDFAWNLFTGIHKTDINVRQKLDDDIIMYKGFIIYDDEEKRICVKNMLDNLEEVYLEAQNEIDQHANFLFYAFKESVNYMRCFFKNRDYSYEEEYRIVLKVPKDIIENCCIKGEIKDIGMDEKGRQYIDYKIQRESIEQVIISPFLSKADADNAECKVNAFFRLNKLENTKIICLKK